MVSIPKGAIEAKGASIKTALINTVSIPKGAIEAHSALRMLSIFFKFQYQKVRLKPTKMNWDSLVVPSFNTKRCD